MEFLPYESNSFWVLGRKRWLMVHNWQQMILRDIRLFQLVNNITEVKYQTFEPANR